MTFNGDHMSMYHVNAGVPKTLVRYLVGWCADEVFGGETAAVLRDVIATPITPELLPLGAGEQLAQRTEETIGPYELHDFFLYYVVRYGFGPAKVYFLADQAFSGVYPRATICSGWGCSTAASSASSSSARPCPTGRRWVGGAFPRGDWRMPSDASSALWLAQVEQLAVSLR